MLLPDVPPRIEPGRGPPRPGRKRRRAGLGRILATLGVAFPLLSHAEPTSSHRPDQVAFRSLYQTLVETNTTLSEGSCTLAAQRMGQRLQGAGFSDADLTYIIPFDHPKEGGLVAVLRGTDPKSRPLLLLAHLDVVEAHRADWARDPFTLVEEHG